MLKIIVWVREWQCVEVSRYNRDMLAADDSDGEETDEEEEQARQERYRVIDEMRRKAATVAAESGTDVGETLRDIDEEAAQQEEFMKLSKMFRTREKLKKIRAESNHKTRTQSSLLGQDPQARKILGRIRRSGTLDVNSGLNRQTSSQSLSNSSDLLLSRSASVKSVTSKRCIATKRSSSFITGNANLTTTMTSTSNKLTTLSKKFVFSIEERDDPENDFATSNENSSSNPLNKSSSTKRKAPTCTNSLEPHVSGGVKKKQKRKSQLSRLFETI